MQEPILVTRWKHPGADSDLIIEGSVEETKDIARMHFEDDPELLVGEPEYMEAEDYWELPEFEG